MRRLLKPLQQRPFNKLIYGFDIETYTKKNKFYCASIWGNGIEKTFFEKQKLIDFFKEKRFRNSIITATNLGFDFFGTFKDTPEILNFDTLFRGSDLIFAKSNILNKEFVRKCRKGDRKITFIDTMNYARLSVDKLGKIIGNNKLGKPSFLGRKPKNKAEKLEMIKYNVQDAKVSALGLEFLYKSFQDLGASVKNTIASTSMSIFRNKFLKDTYYQIPVWAMDKIMTGYYGGRTEAFSRGYIENYNYYDVNSLYPYVMREFEYPNPNTWRKNFKNVTDYIYEYDGMSDITIDCPYMKYPLLGIHFDHKLLFPIGKFRSWQTHKELRRAMELGYNILKVHECHYFKENCRPFKGFVDHLYNLRNKYKEENNPMEYVVKIVMNSLYGKFGQKYRDRDNWIPIPSFDELMKLEHFERFGDFIRIKKEFQYPSNFCVPIWASYVTSHARIHLHNLMIRNNPVYVDTDSIITKKTCFESKKLGKLKLEFSVDEGYIVKPKFYAIKGKKYELSKLKGLSRKLSFYDFHKLLINPQASYRKFTKFKEAMRRNLEVNEIIDIIKNFSLEDTKRVWDREFIKDELHSSEPLEMTILNNNKNEIFREKEIPFIYQK